MGVSKLSASLACLRIEFTSARRSSRPSSSTNNAANATNTLPFEAARNTVASASTGRALSASAKPNPFCDTTSASLTTHHAAARPPALSKIARSDASMLVPELACCSSAPLGRARVLSGRRAQQEPLRYRRSGGSDPSSADREQGQTGGQQVDKFTGRILGPTGSVRSVDFNPDGSRLASAGYDRVVRVWDTETGEQTNTYRFDSARINAVAFSPDGQRLAAGGSSAAKTGEVVIWKINDKLEELADPVLPTLRKAEMAKSDLEVRSQLEDAMQADDKNWQDLGAPQRGVRHRVVKILTTTPALSDQQVASAVYWLTVGRPATDDEMKRTLKEFAETKNRPLNVLQLTRALVESKEFSAGISAANSQLFQTQEDLSVAPGSKRGIGEKTGFLNADEFQRLIGGCAASVNNAVKTDEQFVNLAFLLTLSRFPETVESNQFVAQLKQAPDHVSAAKDVFFFLLNTKEFLVEQ